MNRALHVSKLLQNAGIALAFSVLSPSLTFALAMPTGNPAADKSTADKPAATTDAATASGGASLAARVPDNSADPAGVGALERPATSDAEDPCAKAEVDADPTRPAWDFGAATTQCGVIEADSGWQAQSMGGGVDQRMWVSSLRYGLTPKLDLRVALNSQIVQSGGDSPTLIGIGDQWFDARYRFHEQSRWTPALAFLYGVKIPTANPAKGFGTGFVDHQFVAVASRDFGKNHFDFNAVGNLVGGAHGYDGAPQFGLALTRPVNKKLSAILESYGGAQAGTPDRFGAGLGAVTYALRPNLVFDTAYTRAYTAGAPRQQFLVGITYALHSGFAPLPRGSAFARALGR